MPSCPLNFKMKEINLSMEIRSQIIGVGSYLPQKIMKNDDLPAHLETSDEWITTRTGISQRHIAAEGEMTSDLALASVKAALQNAGVEASTLDFILVATTSADHTFPACAVETQAKLGLRTGFAFDVQAVCSGFQYGLVLADSLLKTGQAKRGAVIGAEIFSRIVDWQDRGSCILFGDGAGAVILQAEQSYGQKTERGLYNSALRSDGNYAPYLNMDGGPASSEKVGKIRMQGREVFKHAVEKLSNVGLQVIEKSPFSAAEIDWVVPHQANIRILQSVAKRMELPVDKMITCMDKHANTSAASIPLALDLGIKEGKIKENDLLLMMAMGGGFTWGASVVRY